MQGPSLSGIVRRRFVLHVAGHGYSVQEVVAAIGLAPVDLCKVIADQNIHRQPLTTFWHLARWLGMPLSHITALGHKRPTLSELIRLGMVSRGYEPGNSTHQLAAAQSVGVSVAVFRRALHGYPDFRPSLRTCERFAQWLAWTGFSVEDIALAASMVIQQRADGQCVTTAVSTGGFVGPYPCACGRPGCFVPAHVPAGSGPRRIWRSDACRMWSKRQLLRTTAEGLPPPALPSRSPIVRFISINERIVPVRF